MVCLDEQALVDFIHRRLSASRMAEANAHLDACATCRTVVATLVATDVTEPQDLELTQRDTARKPVTAMDLLQADRRFLERFLVDARIGEGGMGVVWKARERATGNVCALKVVKFDSADEHRRVLREAQIGRTLRHPHLLDIREFLEFGPDLPFVLVMDLLEGESLAERISRENRLSVGLACSLLHPIASGLAAIHSISVVHRDVTPRNIFLAGDPGAAVRPVLLDFGLAKLIEGIADDLTWQTRSGVILGTPHYMAPEQVYGEKKIDAAADMWALGVVLYECVSGVKPIEGKSFGRFFRNISDQKIAPLGEIVSGVPAKLLRLVDRLLTHDKAKRPSAAEAEGVLRALAGSST